MALMARLLDKVAERIENADGLDPLAARIATASAPLFSRPLVKDLASGTPLGHPLHPLLVTIPIGSWSASLLFDLLGNRKAAQTLVGFGVLAAVPTAVSGVSDWLDTDGAERRVGLAHAAANDLLVAAFTASWLARRANRHGLGLALSMAGSALIGVSGWLGGHLIYALGVGVDTTAFQTAPSTWTDAGAEVAVTVGALTGAVVAGVPVVLSRGADGSLVAYADRCTHRGAPLHEGQLVDGCIECPWHGSRFSLEDGHVVQGPATRPQAPYEVRVTDGRVEVRRADEPRALRQNPVGH